MSDASADGVLVDPRRMNESCTWPVAWRDREGRWSDGIEDLEVSENLDRQGRYCLKILYRHNKDGSPPYSLNWIIVDVQQQDERTVFWGDALAD